jgi:hypothetical protein
MYYDYNYETHQCEPVPDYNNNYIVKDDRRRELGRKVANVTFNLLKIGLGVVMINKGQQIINEAWYNLDQKNKYR